ncbi:ATP-dependent endonuclease [Sphingomonas sp. MG17]|uniref:ATP-dependent endonuclease n=1 Tax=Sphingomonas tagetis TaxID=2949092 RepID=A0A9X2HUH6_9SPHN|nr:AAA family ATPase [Sphingomonas tagetis]MCP3732210.1 ATP-dependent endonuclease [Sphingomonas tagetis]
MQLVHARIRNFRSLRDVSVEFGPHTALIGSNGAGKSSILKAVERFYSTARHLDADDFFGRDQSQPVEIELTFGDLSAQELETFESRVRDGRLVVTRVFDDTASSGRYYGSVLQNADFVEIRAQTTATAKRAAYRSLKESNAAYADLPNATSAPQVDEHLLAWEAQNGAQLTLQRDDGQFFGFQNASRGALQRHTAFVFIPAVREASADAADGKGSAIGRLLELIVRGAILQRADVQAFRAEMSERYQELVAPENMPELGVLADRLTVDLKGLYRDAAVGLAWREVAEFPVPLPVADVLLSDDGFGGPVDRQGHGLQRAFIFTLLQYLARSSGEVTEQPAEGDGGAEPAPAPAPNLILAIEEPELYQHPTKQRHFAEVLRSLSGGALPGVEGVTQVAFACHSPMFVSLGRADEIRLVRRTDCEDTEFKQCELRALNLTEVAQSLENGWGHPAGTFSAATLVPRLHILGTELAEGFFANGVVLVEGRSDKAALSAVARLMGRSFEAAGIALLSAEGKENLDRPLVIFRSLGIPTYVVWDCDAGTNNAKPQTDLALARLCRPGANGLAQPAGTRIEDCYAHFEVNLERTLRDEVGNGRHAACLAAACEPFGITPSRDTQKIPEVVYRMMATAQADGAEFPTLSAMVDAIWLHILGEGPQAAAAGVAGAAQPA